MNIKKGVVKGDIMRAKCSDCGKWAEGKACIETLFYFRTKKIDNKENELVPLDYCKVCSKIRYRKSSKKWIEKRLRERKERRFQQQMILLGAEDEIDNWLNELLEFSPVPFTKYRRTTEKKIQIDLIKDIKG